MATKPEQRSDAPTAEDLVVKGVLTGEAAQIDHWADETPAIARGALIRAEEIRKRHIDAGDAYLMGVGDRRALEQALAEVDSLEAQLGFEAVP